MSKPPLSERMLVFLVSAVQFVNILDFVMVMPLGPDFAKALEIDTAHLGIVGGSYTAAAAVSGLLGAWFLDRFDRRKALGISMLGLVLGTAAGGFAQGLYSLIAARIVAGFFGGPATSLSLSIVADNIPKERIGKALGAVTGAFAIASVLGVPLGLELALRGSWRLPFFAVAGLGVVVVAAVIWVLPPMRGHLENQDDKHKVSLKSLFSRPLVLFSYAINGVGMMAGFALIPNLSAYVQHNLHYPREGMGMLYLIGGIFSFFTTRIVGSLVDRFGSFRIGSCGIAFLAFVIYVGFYDHVSAIPIWTLYAGFMVGMGFRNVSGSALSSKVPAPYERAGFMSMQSVIQHLGAAVGAILSSQFLKTLRDESIEGMPKVALFAICLNLLIPFFFWKVEQGLKNR